MVARERLQALGPARSMTGMTRTTLHLSVPSFFRRSVLALLLLGPVLAIGCSGNTSGLSSTVDTRYEIEDWQYKGAKGHKLSSDLYTIYTTNRRKPFITALPGFLESCYHAYAELLPSPGDVPTPLKTYLFQSRRHWEHFTRKLVPPERAATYMKIRRGGFSEQGLTVSHYSSQRGTLSILAHEGLHQYLEVTGRSRIPAWINEGLACYFESFDLDASNRPVFNPWKNYLRTPGLRDALGSDALIPLKEILGTNAGIAVQQQSRHVRSYYSQEWSLILFLLRDPLTNRYHAGFRRLLDELGTDGMRRKARAYLAADTDGTISYGEAVFRAYVTEDLDAFESDYRAFLHELLDLKEL